MRPPPPRIKRFARAPVHGASPAGTAFAFGLS